MKSIIQQKKECYFCGSTQNLERHHLFGGANRKLSEKYGLTVYLCHEHHNESPNGVHFNSSNMNFLRKIGQQAFMTYYGKTEDNFRKIFGRSYL